MPPQLVAGGPRVLLRRLREIMAERQSAQTRLDKLVSVIAANMVAEVCSIYLRRAGGALELFATEGLNREAVHRTRLKAGEGLVGLVAESSAPLNLSNAPEHPSFSYRPETGEDPFRRQRLSYWRHNLPARAENQYLRRTALALPRT